MEYRVINVNAYLAYAVSCDGEPMGIRIVFQALDRKPSYG